MIFPFAVALALIILPGYDSSFSCLDENGNPVDWFVGLKAPGGGKYYYLDAIKPNKFLTSTNNLDALEGGSIIDSIKQLYKAIPSDNAWAVYNDEDDQSDEASTRAHAKGIIVFDKMQGFWLVHSVPRYPQRYSEGYQLLPSYKYAQSFLCLTLPAKEFEDVGFQLGTYWPHTYDANFPASYNASFPKFASYLAGKKSGQDTSKLTINTLAGKHFTSFAKDKEWNSNLYVDLVAPKLGSDMVFETWQNGIGNMPSNCSEEFSVKNIATVSFPDSGNWTIHNDHSKWGITLSSSKYYFCVGGINRQYSQAKRGGGTVCHSLKAAWSAFDSIINGIEPCT